MDIQGYKKCNIDIQPLPETPLDDHLRHSEAPFGDFPDDDLLRKMTRSQRMLST
jgi:hypothetical protein